MQYTQALFLVDAQPDFVQDVLTQQLADIGFESFAEHSDGYFIAYIPTSEFSDTSLNDLLQDFPFNGVSLIKTEPCEDKDWNEEWEKNSFQPIEIGQDCIIRAPFHEKREGYRYELIINPKMAFGTGTHQTTSLILSTLLSLPVKNKAVLDMGCGTGVLALLARKLGASPVSAIDIDDWCTENAKENCRLNGINDIEIMLGDARLTEDRHFDIIIANINRNILLMDMQRYTRALNPEGLLLMSGFYTDDVPVLLAKGQQLGLHKVMERSKDNWGMLMLKKL